jgi:hypothetical protein
MSYYSGKYSNARAGWGDIFGLTPNDLTSQQLIKMQLEKLVEFVPADGRVDQIIADKIATIGLDKWNVLSSIKDKSELSKLSQTILKYNELVREKEEDIEKLSTASYYNNRENYVFWHLLDDTNKNTECVRWLDSKKTVFNPKEADFAWLFEKYPDTAEKLTTKIISNAQVHSNESFASRMVGLLPQEPLLRHIENIFKCDKCVYMYALSNTATPKSYIIKALRSISGKKRRIPSINVELSKDILSVVPPVMRLGILETLFFYMRDGKITFKDIHKTEDLEALLFGVAIKQNYRVQHLIQRFKHQYERRETP